MSEVAETDQNDNDFDQLCVPTQSDTDTVHSPEAIDDTAVVQFRHRNVYDKVPVISSSEIEKEQFEFIGSGAFGTVYRGYWRDKDVALKVFNTFNDLVLIHREASHLCRLVHPNVVRFYGLCQFGLHDSPTLVMEFAHGGSLNRVLAVHPVLAPSTLFNWALQIATGMAYLHGDAKLVHRDLKPCNILIRESLNKPYVDDELSKCTLLITDFGMACRSSELVSRQSKLGTVAYASPEVCRQAGFSYKSDVWSYGVVLWELLTLDFPFRNMEQPRLWFLIANYNYTLFIPDSLPELFSQLLNDCWSVEPNDRPGFPEIIDRLNTSAGCDFLGMSAVDFSKIQSDWREAVLTHHLQEQEAAAHTLSSSSLTESSLRASMGTLSQLITEKQLLQSHWESLDQYWKHLAARECEIVLKEEQYTRMVDSMKDQFILLAVLAANHQLKDFTMNNNNNNTLTKTKPVRKRPFGRLLARRAAAAAAATSSSSGSTEHETNKRSKSKQKGATITTPTPSSSAFNTERLREALSSTESLSTRTHKRKNSRNALPVISPPVNLKHVVHIDVDWLTKLGLPDAAMQLFPSITGIRGCETLNTLEHRAALSPVNTARPTFPTLERHPITTSTTPASMDGHMYMNLPPTDLGTNKPARPRFFNGELSAAPAPFLCSISPNECADNGSLWGPGLPKGLYHAGSFDGSSLSESSNCFTSESDISAVRKWSDTTTSPLTELPSSAFFRDRNASIPLTHHRRAEVLAVQPDRARLRNPSPNTSRNVYTRRRSASGPILSTYESDNPTPKRISDRDRVCSPTSVGTFLQPLSDTTTVPLDPIHPEQPSVPSALLSVCRLVTSVFFNRAIVPPPNKIPNGEPPPKSRGELPHPPLSQRPPRDHVTGPRTAQTLPKLVQVTETRRRFQRTDRSKTVDAQPVGQVNADVTEFNPVASLNRRAEFGDPPYLGTLPESGRRPTLPIPSPSCVPQCEQPSNRVLRPQQRTLDRLHEPQTQIQKTTRHQLVCPTATSTSSALPNGQMKQRSAVSVDRQHSPRSADVPPDSCPSRHDHACSSLDRRFLEPCTCYRNAQQQQIRADSYSSLSDASYNPVGHSRDAFFKATQDGLLNPYIPPPGELTPADESWCGFFEGEPIQPEDDDLLSYSSDEDNVSSAYHTGQDEDGQTLVPLDGLDEYCGENGSPSDLVHNQSSPCEPCLSPRRHIQRSPAIRHVTKPQFLFLSPTRFTPESGEAERTRSPCGPYVSEHSTLL